MTAVLQRPDAAPAKSLESLTVIVQVAGMTLYRDVHPIQGATLQEIVAALKNHEGILDPSVDRGVLTTSVNNRCIWLADWETFDRDQDESGEIIEVTAIFDDDTSENVEL